MRLRTILTLAGASALGALTSLTLATPADAAVVSPPAMGVVDECDAVGSRTLQVSNPGTEEITIQDKSYPGAITPNTIAAKSSKNIKYTKTVAFQIQFKSTSLQPDWTDLSSIVKEWAAPSACRPVVTTVTPTCEDVTLSISIANPKAAKGDINVGYDGTSAIVIPGDFAAYDGATQTVTYSWSSSALGLSEQKTVTFVKPTNCDSSEPGAYPIVPKPGTRKHGHGQYQHTTPVGNTGGSTSTCSGDKCAKGDSKGGAACSTGGKCAATCVTNCDVTTTTNGGVTTTTNGGGEETLPVTGSSTSLIAYSAMFTLAAGIGALLYWRRNRRVVHFKA